MKAKTRKVETRRTKSRMGVERAFLKELKPLGHEAECLIARQERIGKTWSSKEYQEVREAFIKLVEEEISKEEFKRIEKRVCKRVWGWNI